MRVGCDRMVTAVMVMMVVVVVNALVWRFVGDVTQCYCSGAMITYRQSLQHLLLMYALFYCREIRKVARGVVSAQRCCPAAGSVRRTAIDYGY